MSVSRIYGDFTFLGTVTFIGSLVLPDGTVDNDAIAAGAAIVTSKMIHRYAIHYKQDDGTDVVAAIVPIHTVRGATATILAIEVACVDSPSGGDKAFTVDLKKADQDVPTPATVLSGVINYSSTQADCEVETGTISSSSLVAGDSLLAVIAVSGSTGVQGQGLIVTVWVDETPS